MEVEQFRDNIDKLRLQYGDKIQFPELSDNEWNQLSLQEIKKRHKSVLLAVRSEVMKSSNKPSVDIGQLVSPISSPPMSPTGKSKTHRDSPSFMSPTKTLFRSKKLPRPMSPFSRSKTPPNEDQSSSGSSRKRSSTRDIPRSKSTGVNLPTLNLGKTKRSNTTEVLSTRRHSDESITTPREDEKRESVVITESQEGKRVSKTLVFLRSPRRPRSMYSPREIEQKKQEKVEPQTFDMTDDTITCISPRGKSPSDSSNAESILKMESTAPLKNKNKKKVDFADPLNVLTDTPVYNNLKDADAEQKYTAFEMLVQEHLKRRPFSYFIECGEGHTIQTLLIIDEEEFKEKFNIRIKSELFTEKTDSIFYVAFRFILNKANCRNYAFPVEMDNPYFNKMYILLIEYIYFQMIPFGVNGSMAFNKRIVEISKEPTIKEFRDFIVDHHFVGLTRNIDELSSEEIRRLSQAQVQECLIS